MTEQVTDQRRRKVAARLREAATGACRHVAMWDVIGNAVGIDVSEMYSDQAETASYARLADLVDRPTCAMGEFGDPEIHLDVRRQQCSRCHAVHLEQPNDRLRFRYCPVCGAEVVGR